MGSVAVATTAVKGTGSPDPPAFNSRAWNHQVVSTSIVRPAAAPFSSARTPQTIAAAIANQVGLTTGANIEFRLRRIGVWADPGEGVALDVSSFTAPAGITVSESTVLSLQDSAGTNHRAHVHAVLAPYTWRQNQSGTLFTVWFDPAGTTTSEVLIHYSLEWRFYASEGTPLRNPLSRIVDHPSISLVSEQSGCAVGPISHPLNNLAPDH